MSFDYKLENGDYNFGVDGNPVIVEDQEKLRQDISKILLTPAGSDPGLTQYGSKLQETLGQTFDFSVLQSLVGKSVAEAMNFLQSLQFVQATKQDLSFGEVIGSIDAVSVQRESLSVLEVQLAVTTIAGLRTIYSIRLGEG